MAGRGQGETIMLRRCATLVAVIVAMALALPAALAGEYLVTAAKPNNLYVMDMKAREIVRSYTIPGDGTAPGTIVTSPDGRIAYVVMSYRRIVGIDLMTGKTVFETDMARSGDERVINMGLAVSADGTELYSYEVPARIGLDRYEVLPVRLSVYPAMGGNFAEPLRVFSNLPRRIHMLITKADGSAIYALGWDIYTIDPQTGEIMDTFPLRNWTRENASPPDLLNFWPMEEQSGLFSTLVYYQRTDLPPDDMAAYPTDVLTLDVATGEIKFTTLQIPPQVIFTGTVSPDRKNLYTIYTKLMKLDMETGALIKEVPVDHSYYQVNVSGDGKEVYVGGTMCDVSIYDAETLDKLGAVTTPGCVDLATAAMRMIDLDLEE
ncbi:MAG: quinohemoprotein amine dehydrogenase subunit beta [Alphaproteobacteria bacterium]|nr:MAG: quinohemoprotein amine dehydrogenase subunit beta [Alphaproteobacteria bacterium]